MNAAEVIALAAQATAAPPAQAPNDANMLYPMLAVIALLFYFVILRPQRREQKQAQDMRDSVQRGDRVKSIGGIYGVVTAVEAIKGTVKVRVDKNVELEFDKGAIATVIRKEDEKTSGETSGAK